MSGRLGEHTADFEPITHQESKHLNLHWEKAQPYCNFVLMKPSMLPVGTQIIEQTLRTEAVGNIKSSYRCLLSDGTRKASIKQFLYDWAPPAYDHPSLWKDESIVASQREYHLPMPFPVNHNIAWIGYNYRQQRALSLNTMRTLIEIVILEGSFSNNELVAICKGLNPVDKTVAKKILNTNFAKLSYASRHRKNAVAVPLSYWNHQRDSTMKIFPFSVVDSRLKPLLRQSIFPQKIFDYNLNSVFIIGNTPDFPQEIEYFYEHQRTPGMYLRMLVTPTNTVRPIAFPPRLDDQICTSEIIDIKGAKVYCAFLTKNYGPFEAVWQYDDLSILLLIKSATWTNKAWCNELLHDIISLQFQQL